MIKIYQNIVMSCTSESTAHLFVPHVRCVPFQEDDFGWDTDDRPTSVGPRFQGSLSFPGSNWINDWQFGGFHRFHRWVCQKLFFHSRFAVYEATSRGRLKSPERQRFAGLHPPMGALLIENLIKRGTPISENHHLGSFLPRN